MGSEMCIRDSPSSLQLLFIGESPPASGRFFYRGDSGLYRAMRDAFHAVVPLSTDDNFLGGQGAKGTQVLLDKGKPVARRGRKAMGS